MFYEIPQYPVPGVQHRHRSPNLDLGIGSASNSYIRCVDTSSSVVPINHGPIDQMPSSSNYGLLGVSADEYARNCHFMDIMLLDGIGPVDASSSTVPPCRGNNLPPIIDAGPQRSVRNRLRATAMDPLLMHGSNAGLIETRHRTNFSHPSLDLRNHNYYRPVPPTEGVRNHGINSLPQVAAAPPHSFPATYASQSTWNPSQDDLEMGCRNRGSIPPMGFRIYHSKAERVGVAVLEFPEFYEVSNVIDHYRDMRLDIEDMSYEELLALGEQIGNADTGLSEETITRKLKTMTYSTFVTNINLEEAAPIDQGPDSCIICQEDYKNQEKIATLDCGHEYHAGCLSGCFVKNICPKDV
ncbi:UDP-Glycosyltransferase superfamily protein [Hibiscus syriacus]|uniref:RING-type E3 ubiquitin transferase n=1 Tax=Hibiscus syriacus TaxID=106335 RepID=A0A6A2XG58_HIBSY|nr:UDP-Glycosyltransferase superfamily protein [Hibiscus syriacus]